MWSDYFLYLMGLSEKERNIQIVVIVSFWVIMLILGFLYENINRKLKKKSSNKKFLICCFFSNFVV